MTHLKSKKKKKKKKKKKISFQDVRMTSEDQPKSYYTVVIQELPPSLTAETLRPKLQQRTQEGNYIFQKNGQQQLQIYDKEKHGNIEDCLIAMWTTPLQIYSKLDAPTRHIVNTIKTYINNNKVAVSHHDGTTDNNCQYHNVHLHLMVEQIRQQHLQQL